jgi:hypothetical protein
VWLDTVRIARDLGDVSALLPEGVHSLADAPYPLHDSIVGALHFLKFEELPKDEQPPKRIWFNNEAMRAWVADVERRRKEKYETGGSEPSGPTDDNDAANDLLVG